MSGEHLKELLVGQILWVSPSRLMLVALVYGALLAVWFSVGEKIGRIGFYVLFACAVTISVQLVGLYLVFMTLIAPALATRHVVHNRIASGYALGILGYAAGLVVSTATDLPSGPAIVWIMTALAIVFAVTAKSRATAR